MIKFYLWVNSLLYLAFALWCCANPTQTAHASGYLDLDNSGRCEYLVVYGGLQVGLALIYAYLAVNPVYYRLGLFFSILLYAAIVAFRVMSAIRFWPVSSVTLTVAGMEMVLLISAAALMVFKRPA